MRQCFTQSPRPGGWLHQAVPSRLLRDRLLGHPVLREAASRTQLTTSMVTHSHVNHQRLQDLLETRDPSPLAPSVIDPQTCSPMHRCWLPLQEPFKSFPMGTLAIFSVGTSQQGTPKLARGLRPISFGWHLLPPKVAEFLLSNSHCFSLVANKVTLVIYSSMVCPLHRLWARWEPDQRQETGSTHGEHQQPLRGWFGSIIGPDEPWSLDWIPSLDMDSIS